MPRSLRRLCVALAAGALALASAVGNALTIIGESPGDDARVIVKLRSSSPLVTAQTVAGAPDTVARADALGQRIGMPLQAGPSISGRTQVVLASGITSEALAQRLAPQGDVEYAVPDRRKRRSVAPNDPLYANGVPGNGPFVGQWYLRAPTGEARSGIDAEVAWGVTLGSPAIVVAVLDTGVRFEHPDLGAVAAGGNLLLGYDMISDVATANDGNGRDGDASDPGDWLTQSEISQAGSPFRGCADVPEDSSWHGTQTAGLVAALTDNFVGMASIGRTVRVLPVRVLGKCGGFDSDILAGMRWAAGLAVPGVPANANPARVINMSLGGPATCGAPYQDAINEVTAAGALVVVSAGNAGEAVEEPANCAGAVAAGGLRHAGTKSGFSSLGPEVAISAPAGNCVNVLAGQPCLYPILTTTNTGTTVPLASSYSDGVKPSLGTSFSSPLVAGTAALMLAARPSLSPAELRQILQATARPFPAPGTVAGSQTVPACTAPQLDPLGQPIAQLECYCTTATCGAGMLDAGAAVQAAAAGLPAPDYVVQGLWWNAPAGSESGWGLNLAHQGTVIFATWFTYDAAGQAWWLSMTANRTGPNSYAGTLIQTRGPAFSAVPFDPAQVTTTAVGNATLAFPDADHGTFSYTVNGVSQSKSIVREVYGVLPTCVFALHPPLATATNYQDLWWAAPAGAESGWGINLTHQSDVIFATWFTYDAGGAPLWLSGTANSAGAGSYAGVLYRTTGPAFNAVPFRPSEVQTIPVGTFSLQFFDGNSAQFLYVVNGIAQTKTLTRQVFRTPGTMCR